MAKAVDKEIGLGKILFLFFKIAPPSLEAIEVTKVKPQTGDFFYLWNYFNGRGEISGLNRLNLGVRESFLFICIWFCRAEISINRNFLKGKHEHYRNGMNRYTAPEAHSLSGIRHASRTSYNLS